MKMSLKNKDAPVPGGLRVAANDPHLVSLGGGRLSTAVTIHYLPVGAVSLGSSPDCHISLNGSGVRSIHCTVYRNEKGEVTIVPEKDARVLVDGRQINGETNLTQGAMLTIGNSNYLRFNNPAEAQLIKSTIGSNERISMPQIDFSEIKSDSNRDCRKNFDCFHETIESQLHKKQNNDPNLEKMTKIEYISISNFHSPKVFTADSVTVNAPAKDVLGPKYANFTKNLAENLKNDKNLCSKNNEVNLKTTNYVNIPPSFIQNSPTSNEVLTKVHNTSSRNQTSNISIYDKYPVSYGSLQLFPMNKVNYEINAGSTSREEVRNAESSDVYKKTENCLKISPQEQERLDEILKICTEYDKQNQNLQSSPIVQNRIKTNGSLPRDKKPPFYDLSPQPTHNSKAFFSDKGSYGSGYENARRIGDHRIEIEACGSQKNSSGYENVIIGKCPPPSPRTKIKTTCASPRKDISAISTGNQSRNDYSHLIRAFEDKLKLEMQALKQNAKPINSLSLEKIDGIKRGRKNINNLTLNLTGTQSPTLRNEHSSNQYKVMSYDVESCLNMEINNIINNTSLEKLKQYREEVLSHIRRLKTNIADIQRQEDEVLRELHMEKALVSAELTTTNETLFEMEKHFTSLQAKIQRLEAQRNANRVMQETQQAKLKQAIEMKQEQISRLERLVAENSTNETFKEELNKNIESVENDKRMFEDLEFQYLEEETEWLAYREELHSDLKLLSSSLDEKKILQLRLQNQELETQSSACKDTKTLESYLLTLLTILEKRREELQIIDKRIFEISGQQQNQSDSEDDEVDIGKQGGNNKCISQSMFGSTEILCNKPESNNLMTRSVNENILRNKIEGPEKFICPISTSTPKKEVTHEPNEPNKQEITPEVVRREHNDEKDPILKLKYNVRSSSEGVEERVNCNLSLGDDDFEINPLEKRVPSQDDIDRISKVTSNAPITTKGASNKIFESIKEIERNRQLLLAQQGSHVIEHERQKMLELKKKSQDEATAIYLSTQSDTKENTSHKDNDLQKEIDESSFSNATELVPLSSESNKYNNKKAESEQCSSQQRHSHPELESQQRERPLSEANSEISYDNLSEKQFKSSNDLVDSSNRYSNNSEDAKRSSINSNNTDSDTHASGNKRSLPKHQRPLTRYLPIMSPDLDLRQHIETAGHQISLCPHVFVDRYSCRGYLHKLGATFHGWSRRWFVLDRQRNALIYYSDKSEKKPRGGAYFSIIDEVYLDHLNASKSGRPHCTFIVKTKKRSYYLQAASDSAARIWIDAIITGAQGNIDY